MQATGADSGGGRQGRGINDCGHAHCDGPAPPRGHGTHPYPFRQLALDVEHLDLPTTASAADIHHAARDHTLAEVERVGTYIH